MESISSAIRRSPAVGDGGEAVPHACTDEVWRVLRSTTVAVLGHVTPRGAPRTFGVLYEIVDGRWHDPIGLIHVE